MHAIYIQEMLHACYIYHFTLGCGYTYTSHDTIACIGEKAILLGFLSCAECLRVVAWLDAPSVLKASGVNNF